MAETKYTYADGTTHVSTLLQEIVSAGLPEPTRVTKNRDGDVVVTVDPEYSAGDKTTLDGIVSSHDGVSLNDSKTLRYVEIDNRTQELIKQGYAHDSKIFSLSANAQINWLGLREALSVGLIVDPTDFPIAVSTKNDESHDIVDAAELITMFNIAFATKKGHLDSGRTLRLQLAAAVDKTALDAIEDTR